MSKYRILFSLEGCQNDANEFQRRLMVLETNKIKFDWREGDQVYVRNKYSISANTLIFRDAKYSGFAIR